MTSVPSDKHFSNNYVFSYPVSDKGLTMKIAIVIQNDHVTELELNGQNLTSSISSTILIAPEPYGNYRVIVSDIPTRNHYLRHPSDNVTFSVLLYGLKTDNGIGYNLGYNFDIDECTEGIDDCDEKAECTNTQRSFICTCNEGYTGSGKICTDIDECADGSDDCDADANCTNTMGNFTCVCRDGFSGAGLSCLDIDECESSPCQNSGTCNDYINFFNCTCPPGYEGADCGQDIDECDSTPCQNAGTCNDYVNFYNCTCQSGFEGDSCEIDIDECVSDPCQNDGTCTDSVNFYNCTCRPGYEGDNCEIDIDECDSSPCQNDGACNDYVNIYNCTCQPGFEGYNCEQDINECDSNPCQNDGTCNDHVNFYNCTCEPGYEGYNCETDIGECDSNPCQNGGTCNDYVNFYNCTCQAGFEGDSCEIDIDECVSDPCQNDGTCTDSVNFYNCTCRPGYEGDNCEIDINECDSSPCQNDGTCNDYVNIYNCTCQPGFEGYNCEQDINECDSNPCQNDGTCSDHVNFYNCTCEPGYEGYSCETDIDECDSNPCQNDGTCKDYVNFYNCTCQAGIEGDGCEIDIDECVSDPCQNDGTCIDSVNFYNCTCRPGYEGDNCEIDINECDSSPCQNDGTCNDYVNIYNCTCQPGSEGYNCEQDINECDSNPCQNDGTCSDHVNFYNCTCEPGYEGYSCETDIDECDSNPCQNDGTCKDYVNFYNCTCQAGFEGDGCEIDIDECVSDPCQNDGTCIDSVNFYNCTCRPGYEGDNCEIDIDECDSSPCQNDGTCNDYVNIYNCTCQPGFEGYNCEQDINECDSNPCQNDGTCNDHVNFYNCTCVPGYEGYSCETDIGECDSNPCQNDGTCNDYVNFYNCTCQAGFEGDSCEIDIDECVSDPCQNDGTCTDSVNFYNCTCRPGYEGYNCEIDIDECDSNPCQNDGTCNDYVNIYNCTCQPGFEGYNCEKDINECDSNPCQNDGTCNDHVNLYNCTCEPGYDGYSCETDIDECDSNPCRNGGTCNDYVNFYNCTCQAGFEGDSCEIDIDECVSDPCQNDGTCTDSVNFYNCTCRPGYESDNCEIDIDECDSNPCQNDGTCNNYVNIYNCTCQLGFEGYNCEQDINECDSNPCQNDGTCNDHVNFYNCTCEPGYEGYNCETDIDECDSNPCQNGGTCNDYINFHNCTCRPGFEGNNCEIDTDECDSSPCQNDGMCNDYINFYNCTCQPGFNGGNCEIDIAECDSTPCKNGGTCNDYVNFYNCTCLPGFGGKNCEIDIDECDSSPCQNDGTCNDYIDFYNCTCHPGFNGGNCEIDIDECDSSPCQNDGTCNDNVNFYNCTCEPGYEGYSCGKDIDECDSSPCQNNGTCNDYVNFYNCTCEPGYEGNNCEIDTDECNSSPCQNDGTCNDYINFYNCTCRPGFDGVNCEIDIDECDSNPCQNNGTCNDYVNIYNCTCEPGYAGYNCEIDIDECDSSPCQNGGTCIDYVNFYNCSCKPGFEGNNCEIDVDECLSSPCGIGGTCTDTVNGFKCECKDGFTGTLCRPAELEDDCSERSEVCANLVFAECNGSNCVCITGYENSKGDARTCNPVDCKAVAAPENGIRNGNDTKFGSAVTFDCLDGYMLQGDLAIVCNSSGKWNGTVPTCIEKAKFGSKCENSVMCRTAQASCINGSCTCTTDVYNAMGDICDTMPLYPYGVPEGDEMMADNTDSCSDAIPLDPGIPIFEETHKKIYICRNGLVSFHKPHTSPEPASDVSQYSNKTIVAPFFADTGSAVVYYRHFDILNSVEVFERNDVKNVESMVQKIGGVTGFKAKFILFATWEKVSPFQHTFDRSTTATFQAVIVTDGMDTFTLFVYGNEMMMWTMASDTHVKPDIWIGYTAAGKHKNTNINSFKNTALQIDRHAATHGIAGLLLQRLTAAGTKETNYAVQCIDWYNQNKHMISNIKEMSEKMPECPCSLDSLIYDPWYWPTDDERATSYSVEILPSGLFKPYGKSCSYSTVTWLWINEVPQAGGMYIYHPDIYAREHTENDINAKQFCCSKSNFCHLYYNLHPVGTCYNETWFEIGTTWGDPHFRTLDGNNYTFNGLGEYILLEIEDHGFILQARTRRAIKEDGTQSFATIFTAFAAKDQSNASFHVELNDAENGLTLYGNDVDLSLLFRDNGGKPFRYRSEENNLALIRKDDTLIVFFPSVGIALNITVGVKMLSLNVIVPKDYRNMTRGLLGNYDGLPENDFTAPNGTVLDSNMNDSEIHEYGELWLIDDKTSVFKYFEETTPVYYRNASYVPKFLDSADPAKLDEAKRICGGEQNNQCIFDYVFTDDEKVAEDTKKRKEITDKTTTEIQKTTPSIIGCDELYVRDTSEEVVCPISVGNGDTLDDITFEFINNIGNATFNKTSSELVFIQSTDDPVQISITAVKDGKKAIPFTVNVRLCTGCNGRGNCTNKTRSDHRETESFKYLECECEPQYEGDDCENEFDGCVASPCSANRNCTTLTAEEQKERGKTHICSDCPDGFEEDGDKCIDINECNDQQNLCQHECLNTDGSYECTCNYGYRINSRNSSLCNDINECDDAIHNCSQVCVNEDGGFKCECYKGYSFNLTTWKCEQDDLYICDEANIECSNTAGCTLDKDSTVTCFCEDGFELSANRTACVDIDECERNVCPQLCINTVGRFKCACYSGYQLQDDLTCKECDFPFWGNNCENECKCTGRGNLDCNPVRGCICEGGWQGDTCDDDIDECDILTYPCSDVRKDCVNVPGSYVCRCKDGFYENQGQCEDIDECSNLLWNDCEETCSNTIGGYTCGCSEGLTVYNKTSCEDINECELDLDDCEQRCVNYPKLYNCFCHFGYHLNDDRKTCTEVENPCKEELNLTCLHFCVKSENSAHCECRKGYKIGTDNETCLDIDECSTEQSHSCSGGAECINTAGTYQCKCPRGSKLENDGRTCSECDEYHFGEDCSQSCLCINGYCDSKSGCICDTGWFGKDCDKDKNECASSVCGDGDVNTRCVNTLGSFECRCKLGYRNESGICKDIDECSDVKQNTCDQNCTNTAGSFICNCQAGFAFVNGKCTDIDECLGVSRCDQSCDNTVGSYKCSCKEGFKLDLTDRQSCKPANACNKTESSQCLEKNAECKVTNGQIECYCLKGYSFNNSDICEDVKECSGNSTPCKNGVCREKEGGFNCECETGSYLLQDGITCQVCEETKFGPNCISTCKCNSENTKLCDPKTGTCDCLTGWQGDTCEVDVNECDNETLYECTYNSKCLNTNGSYICECVTGYVMTSDGFCEGCDRQHYGKNCLLECSCEQDNTDFCNNTDGTCKCFEGWTGETCAQDVNECLETTDVCSNKIHSECQNTNGSYKCDCKRGYFPQNNTCKDIDECQEGSGNCIQECENTEGGHLCKCSLGYKGSWNNCSACFGNKFGLNCSQTCSCNVSNAKNAEQSCNTRTGKCLCKPGWQGITCDDDVNECDDVTICDEKDNSGCNNLIGSHSCDCLRGFKQEGGMCIRVTTPPVNIPENYIFVNFVTRLQVTLREGTNLGTSRAYESVKNKAEYGFLRFHEQYTPNNITVQVLDIRIGSLIVNYSVIYDSKHSDTGESLVYSAIDLAAGSTVEYDGQPVRANSEIFGNDTDVCEIYTQLLRACREGYECVKENELPECREVPIKDIFSLYLGVGTSVGFLLVCVLIFIFCTWTLRKRRQMSKVKERMRHMNRLHRDSTEHPRNKDVDVNLWHKSKITTRPQLPEWNTNENQWQRRYQTWRSLVLSITSPHNFGNDWRHDTSPKQGHTMFQHPNHFEEENYQDLPDDMLY
ncbi:uncharacterized protein LOC123523940 isoform X4 [Mercenaria mercenaria]|uniref:uncharacterized protein LOC123523940 isoform X4 n=1 Tax=Mercenaria mercenaria TaxID=6596 RepID=UPI00234F3309|nr:uncharacterized protein LOC123523940 isoform X4 [Mercenaria mercenaria]